MDGGSVAAAPRPAWKLAPKVAERTQGLVVSGFGSLQTGRALFLRLDQAGGAWLAALQAVAPITPAIPPAGRGEDAATRAAALALSWAGLSRMGLAPTALASFLRPFREGMMQEDRLRRLGDRRSGKWLKTVVDGGPRWSANTPAPETQAAAAGAYDVAQGEPEEHVETPVTVHALLLLYTGTEAEADSWAAEVLAAIRPHGATEVHRLPLVLDIEGSGISREHFGFADGLSQPEPFDEEGAVLLAGQPARTPAPVQGVPLGEFLIGHVNGHHEKAPGPVVPGDHDGEGDPRPADAGLAPHPDAQGFFDFGQDGSYLVVRELAQDVAAFWLSMDRAAQRIRELDPANTGHVTAEWLAARVVGRDREGNMLCPLSSTGSLAPGADGQPDSGFLFLARDPRGAGCPAGSHVRRANPRDTLAPTPDQAGDLLAAANNHRILRRGRKYGTKIAHDRADDGKDRGLLFMCLNTDIERQFEFVQQTWMLNSDFATLFEETDPLIGPPGRMTLRDQALRRIVQVESFVRMAGGDYFFLPSLPALRYLASL
jgi:deferrochelatase/peroxidase EfeB